MQGNNLLIGTVSRLDSKQLCAKLNKNMASYLADKIDRLRPADKECITTIDIFEDWQFGMMEYAQLIVKLPTTLSALLILQLNGLRRDNTLILPNLFVTPTFPIPLTTKPSTLSRAPMPSDHIALLSLPLLAPLHTPVNALAVLR
jgi:hypothetical protein